LQSLEGIEKRISFDNKYTLTFKATNGIPENEIKSINRLAENSRGIIIVTLFYRNKENHAIDLLLKKNIPFVNILTQPEERYLNKINSVVPDDYNGGYLAGKHLAETGCERFYALIPEKSKLSIENYRLRLEGFRKALSETGLESELSIKCVRLKTDMFPFERAGFEFGHKLIQNPPERKTGVFTLCSDSYASGLLKALKDNNISVPEHISVCGYDNLAESTPWANDITTIDTSPRTLGYRATEILLNAIESENTAPPENINIPVKLIKRNSTG
jgi:DNA-binding LacI/PurR family transcriptional regulator